MAALYTAVNIVSATKQEYDDIGSILVDPRIWGNDCASVTTWGWMGDHLMILVNILVFVWREISPAKTLNKMHTIHLRWSAILPSLFTLIWMLIWNKTPQRELLAQAYHSGSPVVPKGGSILPTLYL